MSGISIGEPDPALEWPHTLDVDALAAGGWSPRPLRNFILKVHSRCDLACDYCYMYRAADQGWRAQPKVMTRDVVTRAAERIAEHARAHGLPHVNVVLHGGEPLLSGSGLLRFAVAETRRAAGPGTTAGVSVQTNGLLLDDDYLRLFAELGVRVGVSVDGDAAAHDRHRRRADGRGSHAEVAAAVRRLSGRYPQLFGGLLCTVDLGNDPVGTYEALLAYGPPAVDFLLPHGNWASPPPGLVPGSGATPYADWLIAVFDRWYSASPKETGVRIFEEIVHLLLGGTARVEGLGLEPMRCVVIETDGGIQQGDVLKTAYPGAAHTGLSVATASFDDVLRLPSVAARQLGPAALAPTCRACAIQRVCGAGHYAHRYRPGTGFANPSVYCADLYHLIGHIRARLTRDLQPLRRSPAASGTPGDPVGDPP
ncbi:FxsB family cyclophane-forming radical SAM/SPASM peptide maturase [Sphaerisporangium aureirubrum]|uniref:FxsB family cyclophane-forming radical SAM/SPASM peptide maturase n=1 Tax=Sphaerisporangium aureirubrum TaxID=1544736 RepID=A0ABW1NU27_9ACTN